MKLFLSTLARPACKLGMLVVGVTFLTGRFSVNGLANDAFFPRLFDCHRSSSGLLTCLFDRGTLHH